MPRRAVAIRRPYALARRGAYGGGIVNAVARAANSAIAKAVTQKAKSAGLKPAWRRKIMAGTRTRRAGAGAVTSVQFDAPGNDMAKSKRTFGRKKKPSVRRLDLLFRKTLSTQQYRFQFITQQDTNVGALILSNYLNSTNSKTWVPLHIYELTSFNNTSTAAVPGRSFGWSGSTTAADVERQVIPGQLNDGTSDATGSWIQTESSGPSGFTPNSRVMMHDWSKISLLLYGARKRSTEFRITFFRCKDESANPFHAASTNTDLKQLVEYFTRPLIYNSLQTYDTKISKKIRIVKQYKYSVPGCQTTDVDTSVGKLQEVKIFMRHDKVYALDWMNSAEASLAHATADGLDYVVDSVNQNHPWHGSRLFMAITAFSPEKGIFTVDLPTATADRDPSYDIILTNQVTTP